MKTKKITKESKVKFLLFEYKTLLEKIIEIAGNIDFLPSGLKGENINQFKLNEPKVVNLAKKTPIKKIFFNEKWLTFLKISQSFSLLVEGSENGKFLINKLKEINRFFPKETSGYIIPELF